MSVSATLQIQIDQLCGQLLEEFGPINVVIRVILEMRPSKSFWTQYFVMMYRCSRMWNGPSSCPIDVARNNGVPGAELHAVCDVTWKDIADNDYGWDHQKIFECVLNDPSKYGQLMPHVLQLLEPLMGMNAYKAEKIFHDLDKLGIDYSGDKMIFLLGLYHERDPNPETKKMGIRLLKGVPQYSQFLPLPADEWLPNMVTTIDVSKCRVDMKFIYQVSNDHRNWNNKIVRNWAQQMKYSREFLLWANTYYNSFLLADDVLQNADGKDLDLIKDNRHYKYKLEKHPLYIYLNLRKMGPLNKPILGMFYETFLLRSNNVSMNPTMINAIFEDN